MKFLFMPFKWIGMNAMLVYVMAAEGIFAGFVNGWYYDDPRNTLVRLAPTPNQKKCFEYVAPTKGPKTYCHVHSPCMV